MASNFYNELKQRDAKRRKAYARLHTIRTTCAIKKFINTSRTALNCDGTVSDIENEFWELCHDMGAFHNAQEYWKDNADDARAELLRMCPNMPARIVTRYDDTLKHDMLRAIDDAMRNDYCGQFNQFLIGGIKDAIDAAMPNNAVWTWTDVKGEPCDYYEAEYVGIAIPHRAAIKHDHEIWVDYRGNCETAKERNENATDALTEYIDDHAGEDTLRPDFFDDRGYRYCDNDGWQEYMREYCEAATEWANDDKAMRAKLRSMIANRAPLELRAALVATVYGNPGDCKE